MGVRSANPNKKKSRGKSLSDQGVRGREGGKGGFPQAEGFSQREFNNRPNSNPNNSKRVTNATARSSSIMTQFSNFGSTLISQTVSCIHQSRIVAKKIYMRVV
jgi:hypothetical protein